MIEGEKLEKLVEEVEQMMSGISSIDEHIDNYQLELDNEVNYA